jgi:prepilin-type N-terminal cleavage/methylation domain-containing protein
MTAGKRSKRERGYTVVEVMVALTVLLIGIVAILNINRSSMRATAFSRHATEASVLGEDKLEDLRTLAFTSLVNGTDVVNARGVADVNGGFTRTWTIAFVGQSVLLQVQVAWLEGGADPYKLVFATQRHL